jgi:hypothetical protein
VVTFDLYGQLMPGNESEAAGLVDAYLERANTRARQYASAPDSDSELIVPHGVPQAEPQSIIRL